MAGGLLSGLMNCTALRRASPTKTQGHSRPSGRMPAPSGRPRKHGSDFFQFGDAGWQGASEHQRHRGHRGPAPRSEPLASSPRTTCCSAIARLQHGAVHGRLYRAAERPVIYVTANANQARQSHPYDRRA